MNILFLGDSITDCDHCFSPDNLGYGYVKYYSELLHDSSCHTVNGGSDGFTFPRILQKWESMYADQTWDIVCILGGINEVGYSMELLETSVGHDSIPYKVRQNLEHSAAALQKLLHSLLAHHVRTIVILEPFLFESPACLLSWRPTLKLMQSKIQDCAAANQTIFLPLQDYFQQLSAAYGSSVLSADGIHLTEFGHRKLAAYISCELHRRRSFHDTDLASPPYDA